MQGGPQFVQFSTPDGLTLPGLFFEAQGSKKAAIYLHGNGSSSVFYSGDYTLAEEMSQNGISYLLFNNRGAGLIKRLNRRVDTHHDLPLQIERDTFGMAYELIKECVKDIDGAISFLEERGYDEFYLIGSSTGANKICVYDHYKKKNKFKKYILLAGGDDTGIYFHDLGERKFWGILRKSKQQIDQGKGEELIEELLPDNIFSYKGFYDIANPDGDYNCFPYYEVLNKVNLSTKPLFRYFEGIRKSTMVVYGVEDEFAWGDIPNVVGILKSYQPNFDYSIIEGADHGFHGKKKELADVIIPWLKK